MLAISLLRVVFDAWHSVAVDARRTKEYFEVHEVHVGAVVIVPGSTEWSGFKP